MLITLMMTLVLQSVVTTLPSLTELQRLLHYQKNNVSQEVLIKITLLDR